MLLLTLTILAALLSPAASRSVNWYVSSGNTAGNAAFLKTQGSAISGAYLCCSFTSFLPNGSFALRHSPADTAAQIAVFTSQAVEAWGVGGVAEAAIHSGAWRAGLPAAAAASQALLRAGLMGLIMDYEPADNYTAAHAEAYGEFLGALATAIAPLRVGMDIAGWGILGPAFWPHYVQRGVSRFTSMTPTYSAQNVTENRVFVQQALAALPPGSYAAGVGSIAPACHDQYLWTNATLAPFVQFLGEAQVEFLDVWRCDIDTSYDTAGPDPTAPFFLDAARAFLAGD